jgi:hypothetical protein
MDRKKRAAALAANGYYRVLVDLSPHETAGNLSAFGLDHSCMAQPAPRESGERQLHAFASGASVTAMRAAGRSVTVIADADAEGEQLKKNVGKGDRFDGGRSGPPGVGRLI